MAKLVNRAKMTTATTGTGTITLGSAAAGFQTFAGAGVTDGDTVAYTIEDGPNWEVGTGTYAASGTTLSRTVSESSNAGEAISLSGSAVVFVTARAEEFGQVKQISIALSDTTTNITPDAFADLPLDGAVTGDSSEYTVNTTTDEITVPDGGWYRVTAVLQVTTTTTRGSAQAQILVNGVARGDLYGTPYMRNSGSLDTDAVLVVSPWMELAAGDTLTLQMRNGQTNGQVGTLVSGSYVAVEQKGGVGPKGDPGPQGPSGDVATSGTPATGEFARFTNASTIEGRSAAEVRSDLSLGTAALSDTGDFATAAQGGKADSAAQNLGDLGVTATAAELNKLDGATVSTAEINHLSGVSSPIQTQLNAKAPLASPTFTGTPAAPTAGPNTNTTQIATTAFVQQELSGAGGGVDVQEFTSSGTWTKPAGCTTVLVELWGGGGGGGGGAAANGLRHGGGGGGGGAYSAIILRASDLDATESVQIGAGGVGGAGMPVDGSSDQKGGNGGNGGDTTFSAGLGFLYSGGGIFGRGGEFGGADTWGGSGGSVGDDGIFTPKNRLDTNTSIAADQFFAGGILSTTAEISGSSAYGGGCGGATFGTNSTTGGASIYGGGGGGSGCGSDASHVGINGGSAVADVGLNKFSGNPSTADAAPGIDGDYWGLGGTGGGSGLNTSNGQPGGNGAQGGGGGGGGGAAARGWASGAGGDGGDGFARITAW